MQAACSRLSSDPMVYCRLFLNICLAIDFWERVLTRMVVPDSYTVRRESNIGYHRNRKRNGKLQEAPNHLIMTLYQMASSNPVGVLAAGSKILHVRSRG
jgi:hypothetical protein